LNVYSSVNHAPHEKLARENIPNARKQVNAARATVFITLVKNPVRRPQIAASLDLNTAFVMQEYHPSIVGKMLNSVMCVEEGEKI
jgi:hypothetical protein